MKEPETGKLYMAHEVLSVNLTNIKYFQVSIDNGSNEVFITIGYLHSRCGLFE